MMSEIEVQPELTTDAAAAVKDYSSISVTKWFAVYLLALAGCGAWLAMMLRDQPLDFGSWQAFQQSVTAAKPAIKLLVFAIYISLCCTFIPMNTSWIVSAVSVQSVAVAGGMFSTILAVSLVGAAASTMANLNDYHIFTLLMRSRHIAKVRHTRIYVKAISWFEKSPFALLVIFNILPIPIDAVRPLAASHRYSRLRFAVANFVGRLGRYAVISAVTYMLGEQGWIAVVSLVGLAIFLTIPKLIKKIALKSAPTSTQ